MTGATEFDEAGQSDTPGIVRVDRLVRRLGPILTDQDGNLRKLILMCSWGEHRCANYSMHDWHVSDDVNPPLFAGEAAFLGWHPSVAA